MTIRSARNEYGRLAQALVATALVATAGAAPTAPQGPASFRTLSHVRFESDPESLHTLEAHFIGSERARLLLQYTAEGSRNRVVNYRFGADCYLVQPVADSADAAFHSAELEGDQRLAFLRALEIRRALLSWPAGFPWETTELGRDAALGPLGRLEARLGDGDLPVEISVFDADGMEQESLRDVEWHELSGRRWPARFQLMFRGQAVWSEEIVEARAGIRFLDLFFVPRDRRAQRAPFRERTVDLEHVDRPDGWERRVALEARDDWSAAWSEATDAARRAHEELRALGCDHAPVPSLVLSKKGRAEAIVLHLKAGLVLPDDPETAARWTRTEGGPALRLGTPSLGEAAGEGLRRARKALPAGARVAEAQVRLVGTPDDPLAVLVLALDLEGR